MADYTVTAANVLSSRAASRLQGIGGESISQGQPVTLDEAAAKWFKADADNEARSGASAIALNAVSVGQPIIVVTADPEFTPGFPLEAGEVVVVSRTPGGLKPYSEAVEGDYVTVVMIGIGDNKARLVFAASGAQKPAPPETPE